MTREEYLDLSDDELIKSLKKAGQKLEGQEIAGLLYAACIRTAVLTAKLNAANKDSYRSR